jgi:hypothetical protein
MKTRVHSLICAAALAASLSAIPALAQSIAGGTISGIVKDPNGGAVPAAVLKLQNAVTS